MASDLSFVQYVADQIESDCNVSWRMMFGEYVLYSKGKVVALICDNQLFVKATDAGREFIGKYTEAPPYKGAKMALFIGAEMENREWITQLVRITEKALPQPKKKK
jgi:TfoX/Sxy family transcriptional regulator of competence genes